MIAYVPCSACQTCRIPVASIEEETTAPLCLVCQLRQTQQGLNQELAATWQALGVRAV